MRTLLRAWNWSRLRKRLADLQLLVLDVDGVLTDGGLWLDPNGQLQKRFDVRDGLGLRLLQNTGLKVALSMDRRRWSQFVPVQESVELQKKKQRGKKMYNL